ncbi:hypothetical protein B0J18DRAFT_111622 [Chaetomium sp. MPI-SDFR-AT-0129]|nr:hypothetical protein B0J18DRAFT_111622 [Chaetomium sp. MPI-SDFR-AT-0129]
MGIHSFAMYPIRKCCDSQLFLSKAGPPLDPFKNQTTDLARSHRISVLPINNNLQGWLVSPTQHLGLDWVLRVARLPMLIFFTARAFGPHQARSVSTSGGSVRAMNGCGNRKIGQQRWWSELATGGCMGRINWSAAPGRLFLNQRPGARRNRDQQAAPDGASKSRFCTWDRKATSSSHAMSQRFAAGLLVGHIWPKIGNEGQLRGFEWRSLVALRRLAFWCCVFPVSVARARCDLLSLWGVAAGDRWWFAALPLVREQPKCTLPHQAGCWFPLHFASRHQR